MYSVQFRDSSNSKQLVLSVVHDAGYALILPWMPVPVSMITLTQVVSGTSTVVARAAIGREIPDLKHLALTVDGTTAKVYFRGRLLMVDTLSTTMTIDRVELQGGTKDTLLSEMLLMPRVAEPEDIAMWHNLRAPFYDPSPHIPAEHQPVTVKGAGADIDIDKYGIRATRKADGKKTFEIDAETGDAFFRGDITGSSGTFADGRVAIGDISGKPWGDGQLPAGTYGLWAPDGFVATSNTKVLQINDEQGTSTTSKDWVDVPGFNLDFTLDYSATVFIIVTLWGGSSINGYGASNAHFRLLVNNEHPIGCTALVSGHSYIQSGTTRFRQSTALQHLSRLPQGQNTAKLQFRCGTGCDSASIFHRIMSVLIIK